MTTHQALMLAGLLAASGCLSMVNRDISTEERFSSFVGESFKTKEDLILFRYKSRKSDLYIDEFGVPSRNLPSRESLKKCPYNHGFYIIEGVFPKGSVLNIDKLIEDNDFENSSLLIVAQVTASPDPALLGKSIRLQWLLTHIYPRGTPEFKPSLVERAK